MTNPSPSALENIRVIDLTRVLAGPYCTMLLGDYGAEIIKVEQAGVGDGTRQWGPPWLGDQAAYFMTMNRNKKSITLNLKTDEGREVLRQLVDSADILIENFKVGDMAKWGLDYDSLHERNPRLIMCSITGYGQTGPYRKRAGYDAMIQAQGGIMSITGPEDGAGSKVGVAIVDITTGLFASNAIMAALHHRESSGEGQYIDVALFDTQLAWLANVAHNHFATGEVPKRFGNGHASLVPYQDFPTADGAFMLAIGSDRQYKSLCEAAGRSDLWDDVRFQTNHGRVTHRDDLIPHLETLFQTRKTADWLSILEPLFIPCAPINDVATALADPQTVAREMVQTVTHPTLGEVKQLGPVAKLSVSPATIRTAPPLLGAHTDEVLAELGISAETIKTYREQGVI